MTSADDNHGGVVERPGTPESSTPNHASTPSVSIGVTDIATWNALQKSWAAQRLDVDALPQLLPRVIVGLDISWDSSGVSGYACAVTMGLPGLQLLRPPLLMRVETQIAYASGYLGFREVPSYLRLIQQLRHEGFCIDVLAVDGFGALHPRGAGAATQLGVQAGLCSIGVGKSLPGTCSLREREVVELMDKSVCLQLDIGFFCSAETMAPSGELKQIRCVAVRKDVSSRRPVYVTVGHMASIDTAVSIITSCIIFSQPEPIRLADIASRAALRVQPHQAEVSATAAVHSAVASYTRKLMH